MTKASLPADFDTRFMDAVAQIIGTDTTDTIGIAVSGGPDSLALLLLAHHNFPSRISAATVDHQLRHAAADEARYVARICKERGIPHETLHPASPITGNIQSSARAERYRLLSNWATQAGCNWIATAHHAQDQLETLLMRLKRGSGVAGMAGVRARNGNIIRPLLAFSKTELIAICTNAGITPIVDPSNDDTDFDRVRMRQWLSAGHPLGNDGPSRTAAAMADAAQALEWATADLAARRIECRRDFVAINVSELPHEFERRLLITGLLLLQPDITPRGASIENAIKTLLAGNTCMIGNILCKGGAIWHLCLAPPRRSE